MRIINETALEITNASRKISHYRIIAIMPANQITAAMSKAAPELCQQMDELRKERKPLCERHSYLGGGEGEAASLKQRIEDIDAKVATLHAQAKEQLVTGIATDLSQGAADLRCASRTTADLANSLADENKRHSEAVATIAHLQRCVGLKINDAVDTMDAAAGALANGDEEQAPEPGAGSSSDTKCPHCSKLFSGSKGLATHLRTCKKAREPGSADAIGASKPAESSTATVVVCTALMFWGVFHFDPSAPSASLLAFTPNFSPAPPPAANIGSQALCAHSWVP